MGARGPLRDAHSVRGERERRREREQPEPAEPAKQEQLKIPAWLPAANRATWRRVVAGLREANVPLERIDAEAIALYVACIDMAAAAAKVGDTKLLARAERDALQWAAVLGATPAARSLTA